MARKRGTRGKEPDPINAVGGVVLGLTLMIWALSGRQGVINAATGLLKLALLVALVVVAMRWWKRRRRAEVVALHPTARRTAMVHRGVDFRPSETDRTHDAYDASRIPKIRAVRPARAANAAASPVPPARPTRWSREVLQLIEWKRFEELLESLWQARGYRAELTGRGADGGVDIRLYRPSAPDRLLGVIQCKSRASEAIGVNVARELFGVMHHEQVPLGILAASYGFTTAAREFAAGKHLQLWDGDEVLRQVLMLDADARARLLDRVTRGDFWTPSCPSCDVKLVVRTSKSGTAFYGCQNYPRCRTRINSAALA